jgi:transcriptional regulator with XRE-family HTH domain
MKLAAARRLNFWSIRELAQRANVATRTINNIELGRTTPSLATIKSLSEALGVDALEIDEFRDTIMRDRLAPASV